MTENDAAVIEKEATEEEAVEEEIVESEQEERGENYETDEDTDEQKFDEKYRLKLQDAYYHWHTHGYPEKAAVLYECIQQERLAPSNLLMIDAEIQPQTSVDPLKLEIPARHGPGATDTVWREFAKKTLDMEPVLIDSLKRDDIIKILESNKVIPKEEPQKKTRKRQSPKKK